MTSTIAMTSNRPYLLRALYEWINDNNLTPYVLADATLPGVQVPKSSVKDGKVVLNIAMRAVASLEINNFGISFMARFSGKSQSIFIPIESVIAIYAQETGQGMMLPPDESQAESHEYSDSLEQHESESGQEQQADDQPKPPKPPNPPKGGHLRIVK
jgi:stringent starvation protein B